MLPCGSVDRNLLFHLYPCGITLIFQNSDHVTVAKWNELIGLFVTSKMVGSREMLEQTFAEFLCDPEWCAMTFVC